MRVVKRLFGACLLVLPLALVACGGGGLSPESAVAEAASKTRDESARVHYTASVDGGSGGTIEAEGAFAADSGRMTMDLSGLPGAEQFGNADLELVFIGTVIYMRFPPKLAKAVDLPAGKSWISLDLAELGRQSGVDLGQLGQFSQSDPSQTLEYLRGASDDFEELGEEEVRGTATTHYSGTIDLQKVADGASEEVRSSYERVIELAGTSDFPVDVWIDDEGRARRMTYDTPLPPGSGGSTMSTTMEFYDFGTDVSVDTPPEAEVIDLIELAEGR